MNKLDSFLKQTVLEDAPNGDITVNTLFTHSSPAKATLVAKENGLFVGQHIISTLFNLYAPQTTISFYVHDGESVSNTTPICTIETDNHTLMLLERTMLNIVQRLSGIATLTNSFVKALNNPRISICDTRKTTPLLRALEKEAVVFGGGHNHRFGLSDMILIKENHLSLLQDSKRLDSLPELLRCAKQKHPNIKIEIEIESIEQLMHLDLSLCDYIMLDNFKLTQLDEACSLCRKKFPQALIEVSGNISLDTIPQYSTCDIDRISIGALTHSVRSLDLSLLV